MCVTFNKEVMQCDVSLKGHNSHHGGRDTVLITLYMEATQFVFKSTAISEELIDSHLGVRQWVWKFCFIQWDTPVVPQDLGCVKQTQRCGLQ